VKELTALSFFLAVFAIGQTAVEEIPAPPQPIPFSHKKHVALGVKCLDCHPIRQPGFAAGFPKEATCMGCHLTMKTDSPSIQKLAEFNKAKKPVPWVKVYRVPDYVWFSHEVHHREAKLECAECHGPVAQRDVIAKEKSTSMNACMDCHRQKNASNECDVCHDKR
jgi:hypothetical protein